MKRFKTALNGTRLLSPHNFRLSPLWYCWRQGVPE